MDNIHARINRKGVWQEGWFNEKTWPTAQKHGWQLIDNSAILAQLPEVKEVARKSETVEVPNTDSDVNIFGNEQEHEQEKAKRGRKPKPLTDEGENKI